MLSNIPILSLFSVFAWASVSSAKPVNTTEEDTSPQASKTISPIEWETFKGNGTYPGHWHKSKKFTKRGNLGGIYICTDANWYGTCGYAVQPLGVCIVLTDPYYHSISSMGPDDPTLVTLFRDNYCADSSWVGQYCGNGGPCLPQVYYPGVPDFSTHYFSAAKNAGYYNDQVGSFWVRSEFT
ncbi:hypothetical protein TWF694_001966 [Orbilia ellipsospora]|uniref:Uncharacterized protein n=1 Tax=Orbilia ellipsospora TaxID=2528407 RepID=A0AAV9X5B9_9PEZI